MTGFTNKPLVTARFERLHPRSPSFQAGMRDRTRPDCATRAPGPLLNPSFKSCSEVGASGLDYEN